MPFGHRHGSFRTCQSSYPKLMLEWHRVLRVGGTALLVTTQKKIMMAYLKSHQQIWRIDKSHMVDVGGFDAECYYLTHLSEFGAHKVQGLGQLMRSDEARTKPPGGTIFASIRSPRGAAAGAAPSPALVSQLPPQHEQPPTSAPPAPLPPQLPSSSASNPQPSGALVPPPVNTQQPATAVALFGAAGDAPAVVGSWLGTTHMASGLSLPPLALSPATATSTLLYPTSGALALQSPALAALGGAASPGLSRPLVIASPALSGMTGPGARGASPRVGPTGAAASPRFTPTFTPTLTPGSGALARRASHEVLPPIDLPPMGTIPGGDAIPDEVPAVKKPRHSL